MKMRINKVRQDEQINNNGYIKCFIVTLIHPFNLSNSLTQHTVINVDTEIIKYDKKQAMHGDIYPHHTYFNPALGRSISHS